MKAKLLSALFLLAMLLAAPLTARAQGWSTPCGNHLGWVHGHTAPAYCCPPNWRWYTIRNRAYPQTGCYAWKGTLEPYDENGLLLPPTSRPGALPVSTIQGMPPYSPTPAVQPVSPNPVPPDAVPPATSSRRPAALRAQSDPSRQ